MGSSPPHCRNATLSRVVTVDGTILLLSFARVVVVANAGVDR
jgi:hypothetical protein